jgi:hypothetical protein
MGYFFLWQVFKIDRSSQSYTATLSHSKIMQYFLQKMDWAKFWAIFSQTQLVTLPMDEADRTTHEIYDLKLGRTVLPHSCGKNLQKSSEIVKHVRKRQTSLQIVKKRQKASKSVKKRQKASKSVKNRQKSSKLAPKAPKASKSVKIGAKSDTNQSRDPY